MYLFVFSILIPYCDEFEHEGKEVKRSGEAYQFQDSKPHTQFVETRLGKYQLLLCDPKMFWHELTVRPAMRQQGNAPSSVISSHSMHLGVLATAWHAIQSSQYITNQGQALLSL
ncbi:uncharacterized protein [Solanum tuberosum]|uniref:uncharacterized protein isoform X2 n=1 Tax=Solanum tuberosum TaxID=4113 RepID=UPI0003D250DE|nr:PREDICTED: uncharacterized protein LOC102587277 isoform X2 [Solanum tuberosum]